MKEFKYDVVQLIRAVKERPVIWNKSLEAYKDRVERRRAWEEIFNLLDVEYEDSMSPEEQRLTGELVINKWTNIRDTFVKSLRPKMGKPKRKYILYEHLTFLLGTVAIEEPQYAEEVGYLKVERQSEEEIEEEPAPKRSRKSDDDDHGPNTSKSDKRKSKKKEEAPRKGKSKEYDSSVIDFVEVDESVSADQRLMNEDEAFFASLLPTVVKYSEDERLEFRMEVLRVMKRIKESRRWCDDS